MRAFNSALSRNARRGRLRGEQWEGWTRRTNPIVLLSARAFARLSWCDRVASLSCNHTAIRPSGVVAADTEDMAEMLLEVGHTCFVAVPIRHTHSPSLLSQELMDWPPQPPFHRCPPQAAQSAWKGWRGKNNRGREWPSIITSTTSHTQSCFQAVPTPDLRSVGLRSGDECLFLIETT